MTVPDPVLADLVDRVRRAPALLGGGTTPSTLVLIDGPAGSGKTTLAAQLAAALPAAVVHMDDLYPGWSGLVAGRTRLDREILTPLSTGRPGRYRRYDWPTAALAESHDVPPGGTLVIEGCGCGARRFAPWTSLLVWVEADDTARLARGLARDGATARPHWEQWMRTERAVYRAERTAERADLRLDGDGRPVS